MNYLDAINLVLRAIGEYPVDSPNVPYPTVQLIKPALDEQRTSLLTQGWWFNTHRKRTLQPDSLGQVAAPTDALVVIPETERFVWNGAHITRADGSAPDSEVVADLIMDMHYESLPLTARYAVAYAAAYTVYVGDFGNDNTAQVLQQQAVAYFQSLTAQHVRTRKYSVRHRPSYQTYLASLRQ